MDKPEFSSSYYNFQEPQQEQNSDEKSPSKKSKEYFRYFFFTNGISSMSVAENDFKDVQCPIHIFSR